MGNWVNTLRVELSRNTRWYIALVIWGLAQGLFAAWVAKEGRIISEREAINVPITIIALGGITSAIIFALMMRLPVIFQTSGFLIVSTLIPIIVITVPTFIQTGQLWGGGQYAWLVAAVTLGWAISLLPFSVLSAILYYYLRSSKK